MQNLKLLKLNYMSLSEWLSWRNCSLRSIPGDFPLENIVVIDIRYNSLKQLWKGVKVHYPNIEKLILKDCVKLELIHESICVVKYISLLNLKGCKSLRNLPKNMGAMKSLKTLDISGCLTLQWVPMQLTDELDFSKLRFQSWRNSFVSCILHMISFPISILISN
ncbi:hypothetical protein ACJIZ3_019286 [Penstemon smallii]|uniref:Uncharacterized protein n=1 Tax=Penstemon smallii TaxID=265156 RepID=A0ABD3T0R0_9LAMI